MTDNQVGLVMLYGFIALGSSIEGELAWYKAPFWPYFLIRFLWRCFRPICRRCHKNHPTYARFCRRCGEPLDPDDRCNTAPPTTGNVATETP